MIFQGERGGRNRAVSNSDPSEDESGGEMDEEAAGQTFPFPYSGLPQRPEYGLQCSAMFQQPEV